MNLTIDIGNSTAKVFIFKGNEIVYGEVWKEIEEKTLVSLFEKYPIKKSILSSVVHHAIAIDNLLAQKTFFINLHHDTPLPISNLYQTPQTLGKDRIASVVGGAYLYPDQHILCIDAGTCITYDFLNKKGEYLGGGISPGMMMRFRAMHHFTAKLPLLDKQRLEGIVGYNTETSMQVGGQLGTLLEIEGFIRKYKEKFGQVTTLITGGDAEYFATQLESKIFAHPNLVLIGLNKILEYNAKLLE